jgi:hypothetical protein
VDDSLLVDTGDVINGAGEFAALKAQFYEKALPYLHYDAVGVGEMDARYMKEFGKQSPYAAGVPVISANMCEAMSSKPLASAPYIVKTTKNGVRVGIISVISEALVDPFMQDKIGIRSIPVKEALKNNLAKLRKDSDIVVLLYHGDLAAAKAVAQETPNVDIMLVGHTSGVNQDKAEQIGNVIVMPTRSAGKYMGKIVLDISAERKITASTSEYVALDTSYEPDEAMTKLVTQNDKDTEDYYGRMRMQYARYSTDPAQPREPKPFVTTDKCVECHAKETQSWEASPHAKALDALKKDHREHDPDCLSCHTTGYKLKGGFTSVEMTPELADVQCEACHGPGVIHSRRPAKGFGFIMQSTCTQCHDRAHSPKFDYDVYKIRAMHKTSGTGAALTPVSH